MRLSYIRVAIYYHRTEVSRCLLESYPASLGQKLGTWRLAHVAGPQGQVPGAPRLGEPHPE